MDTLKWDPLSEEVDQSSSGGDSGLLGDFICPTCGDESPDLETHQIHTEICNQVKSGKFKSPLSIQELVNLRKKIDANRSIGASESIRSQPISISSQVIPKRMSLQGSKLFPCFKCGKEYERAGLLIAHEMKHTEEAGSQKDKEVERAADTFSNNSTFAKPKPFHCPFCNRKFSTT